MACACAKARRGPYVLLRRFYRFIRVCDLPAAKIIRREVSDGVIARLISKALEILKSKRKGTYNILVQMDEKYQPAWLSTGYVRYHL